MMRKPESLFDGFCLFATCSGLFCIGVGFLRLAVFILFSEWS